MRWRTGRWPTRLGMLGTLAAGYWLGQGGSARLAADPPAATAPQSDYSQRVVAYVYGGTAITREDLGEYLIKRFGSDRVELLVNKFIIDRESAQAGVAVTDAEVEAQFQLDLKSVGVDKKGFVSNFLKQKHLTEYEWREDVLKPRLQLKKLCEASGRIKIDEDDLKKMYEHRHGEKRKVRLILWPKEQSNIALKVYDEIRKSEEAFRRYAATQANATLAARGGEVAPIGRHGGGESDLLEKEAFLLRPGEVSRIIDTSQGPVVMKCDAVVPPDGTKYEDIRDDLHREVVDRKVEQEIPKFFADLRKKADPQFIMKKPITAKEQDENALKLIQGSGQPGGEMIRQADFRQPPMR